MLMSKLNLSEFCSNIFNISILTFNFEGVVSLDILKMIYGECGTLISI